MTKVPLFAEVGIGVKVAIGTCEVTRTEQGGWELKGEVTNDRFKDIFRLNKFNPDYYSVAYHQNDFRPVEVAFVPPLSIPKGRAQFMGVIPPRKDSNDD